MLGVNKLEKELKNIYFIYFNSGLLVILLITLLLHFLEILPSRLDSFILITTSIITVLPIVWQMINAFKNKKIPFDFLVTVALVASLLAGEIISAVIIGLMLTSARILGIYIEDKARLALTSLLKLKPQKVRILTNNQFSEVAPEKVNKNDTVVVELGERIPIDGTVIEGNASVDQSTLTGESLPVEKRAGDAVLSSTMVLSGNLTIRAEKVGKETTLEKIIELVNKAGVNKSKISSFSDKLAVYYSIVVVIGSILIYLISGNFLLVLSVILIVSAEDVAIAIPLAFVSAIGHAAKRGVIIKGGNYLEGLRKVKILMVDKTGTLTIGKLKVEEVFIFNKFKKELVLSYAAGMSGLSEHPSAKAILNYADIHKIEPKKLRNFREESGKGSRATINGKEIIIGKLNYLKENNVVITEQEFHQINLAKEKGVNTTLISYNKKLIGLFTLADEIKPDVKEIISELKQLGVSKIVMLTGDNEKIALRIAKEAGITDFHANLLPEDKIKYLKKYLSPKYKVMAIGDGVNDAALLTAADIGVAMGGIGADVTIESGDIVLMHDDLRRIPELIKLSHYTMNIAYQDLIIWGVTNSIGLLLVFGGYLHATGAAAYNFFGDFPPLLNSIRLLGLRKKEL